MLPLLIPAIIGAVATAAGGAAQAIGAGNAAGAQRDAAQRTLDFQREMWNQQRADQAPWLEAGKTSLADLLRFGQDPSSIANNPAFLFRLSEGQKALERSAAARGGLASGGFMRGLARYGQGVASDEYGNQWNRLASLAGVGQTAAQNLGVLGYHAANQIGNAYGDMGNAAAAGSIGTGNAFASTLGQLGGIGTGAAARYYDSPPGMGIPTQATQYGNIAAGRSFNPY